VPFPPRKIIHAEHLRRRHDWEGQAADEPQERVPTRRNAEPLAQPCAGRPPEGQSNGRELVRRPSGLACPEGGETRHPFREDPARALLVRAEKLPDTQPHPDADAPQGRSVRTRVW
jgi:hypothetical protein